MNKKTKFGLFLLAAAIIGAIVLVGWYLRTHNAAVLNPQGQIAQKERNLMAFAVLLMMVVVVPVFALTIGIVWKYRASNTKAKYTPDWDHNRFAETLWWGIPSALILVLSVVTWSSAHSLDPYKAISSTTKPMTIQVVALDWKWLFIYPDQHIATVNYVQFPENTPVDFEITSDAPMNSFWIPQLGGQMYAMPGMSAHLHLVASGVGDYAGSSANISGVGFAGMKFVARSSTKADFDSWIKTAQHAPKQLDQTQYTTLAKPSQNNAAATYSQVASGLYDTIIMNYMMPMPQTTDMENMNMTGMGM